MTTSLTRMRETKRWHVDCKLCLSKELHSTSSQRVTSKTVRPGGCNRWKAIQYSCHSNCAYCLRIRGVTSFRSREQRRIRARAGLCPRPLGLQCAARARRLCFCSADARVPTDGAHCFRICVARWETPCCRGWWWGRDASNACVADLCVTCQPPKAAYKEQFWGTLVLLGSRAADCP